MTECAETDVVIAGAGPVALFSVFQLGLYGLRCHLIDSLDRAGGQCAVLYPDKPIHDIPGFPAIDGLDLTARLLAQAAPFDPVFHFRRTVAVFGKRPDGRFETLTQEGDRFASAIVVLATGIGTFMPGEGPGGDASLRPGPAGQWLLARDGEAFRVDAERFMTSTEGVFAIGDACHYPGKLRLILSGFHEAALMTQAARRICFPQGRNTLEYTTTSTRLKNRLGKAAPGEE